MSIIKVLVTGANGQLGNEIRRLESLYSHNYKFIFTDVGELDITKKNDVESLFHLEKPDFTINCAAYTAVDKAESDFELAHLLNCEAVKILGEATKKHDSYLIHISTDYVFDGTNFTPYKEDDKVNPTSKYGQTKLEGENAINKNSNAMIIRTSWLYSSYGNNFVKTMIRLGKERESLKVVFDQIGTPTYAADLAKLIMYVIDTIAIEKKDFQHGIYHFSDEGVCSWYDFAVEIFDYLNINCRVEPILSHEFPTPVKRPHFSVLDKAKIKKTFSYNLIPHWKVSLHNCLKTLDNQ
jgi:dTDP-4-dehydrorhamnose reductase